MTRKLCLFGLALALCSVTASAEFTQNVPVAAYDTNGMQVASDPATIATVDLTVAEADIWARIRHGFGMPDLSNEIVEERQRAYLARPDQLRIMLDRSRKYMYHIVGELEKRGMPSELALLPLVESAFNPMAMSPAKAAGLWQFVPGTGRDFNLTQNWWVDERRDIVASTNAALQYLQAIYEMQGDWHLALASYNWGENAVARAVAANKAAGKPTDFAHLNMPAETRHYVPKLQALKNIIAHPEQYGFRLPAIPNEPYFVPVPKPKGIDVALAARLADMPVSDFVALNPGFNRPVIPGSHDAPLVLPVGNADKFRENLAKHDEPLVTWRTYSLPKRERIEQVAKRFNLTVDVLLHANGIPPGARLAAGYTLLVPIHAAERLHQAVKAVIPASKAAVRKVRDAVRNRSASKKVSSSKKNTNNRSNKARAQ